MYCKFEKKNESGTCLSDIDLVDAQNVKRGCEIAVSFQLSNFILA